MNLMRGRKGWTLLQVFSIVILSVWIYGNSLPAQDASAEVMGRKDEQYLLRPGDRVNIKIYPEDEDLRGGQMEISSEGNITLPLVGKVAVSGKTAIEAEKMLTEILGRDYLVSPEVVVEVLEYQKRSFVILGAVSSPGTYPFPEGVARLTLLRAISLSGGFSDVANIKKIKIMRKKTGEVFRANAEAIIGGNSQDLELQADDVIHVSESLF